MTYAEFVDLKNDPRRRFGVYGPIGFGGIYRIALSPQERAEFTRRRGHPVALGRPAAPTGRHASPSRTVEDQRVSQRIERHRKDAEHDRIVRRLRALR